MNDFLKEMKTRKDNCEMHGEFESRNYHADMWSRCTSCANEEAEIKKAEKEKKEKEDRAQRWLRYVDSMGIPPRFADKWFKDFKAETEQQKEALKFAEDYVDDFDNVLSTGRSALFVGRAGTGKTHLAASICLNVTNGTGKKAVFTTVMRAIRKVKDTWRSNSEMREVEVIKSFVAPDLLVMDEVGVQFGSDAEKLILFDIINERYEKKKPTILISNLTTSETKEYLGERIYDRLKEDGGKAIKFDWESHRGK